MQRFAPISRVLLAFAGALLLQCHAAVAEIASGVIGGGSVHVVRKGDFLIGIGSRYGVSEKIVAEDNGLYPPYRLKVGDELRIDNRHIVPQSLADGIVINIPQRMLFLFRAGRLVGAYPAGLGRADWRTPTGNFHVTNLERNKTWCVPHSIQEEMRRSGRTVVTHVPSGPENPLGEHWIGLSISGYGIHGTIAPASVYRMRTHGCIRLHPDDIAVVYAKAYRGMPVKIVYVPAMVAQRSDGRIMAEVNPDVYNRGGNPLRSLREHAAAQGLTETIDWIRAAEVARLKEGIARDITHQAAMREKASGRRIYARVERETAQSVEVGGPRTAR